MEGTDILYKVNPLPRFVQKSRNFVDGGVFIESVSPTALEEFWSFSWLFISTRIYAAWIDRVVLGSSG